MWKLCFLLLVACLCIEAKGHAKQKKHDKAESSADDIDFESEFDDGKRDAIAKPYDYSQYQTQYNTATPNQAAAYTSSSTSSYPAATSSDSFSATQRAAVAAPQPAAAPAASPSPSPAAPAPASPAPAPAAPAPAPAAPQPAAAPAASPSPSPAAPAPAPAAPAPAPAAPQPAAAPAASPSPAAAAPAPAPAAPASPAAAPAAPAASPAPAPAAPAPAPAAAYPAPAPSTAAHASSQSRSDFPSAYQQSSASSYYTAPPAPAPAPAPAAYYYRQPSTATATVAAAASQAASSTLAYTAALGDKNTCSDDKRADHFCSKAHNPCYCEENHHFMYNYCKRSCNWCSDMGATAGHRFWRIVNSALLPRSWIIKEIEFYTDKHAKKPIKVNPAKAYASTSYPGYFASNAFDGKKDTYWLPEGWYERQPGLDYIGMEFDQPVSIGAVKITHQSNEKNATSTKMYLEQSDFYENNYFKVFNMENPRKKEVKKYSYINCPIYWRRYDTGDNVYCLKTLAEFLTWQQARDKCATYGAELLSIDSPGENMFVNNELRLCGFTWLGLNDIKNEGNFTWSDGKPMTFKSWAGDESYYEQDDYLNSKQNCVAAARTGEWRPFHCDDKFYAVCKMKLKVPDEDDDMEEKGHYHHDRVSKKSSKGHKKEEDEDDDEDEVSGNTDVDLTAEDTDSEDALKEIKKNVQKAQKTVSHKKTSEDEEDDEEEEEDESGSGSEDDNDDKPKKTKKHVKGSRKEEIGQVDDFFDLKH
ncbi:uncharacterized protein LOC110251542 isoform X2 [Exaiptasia diaphana]|uniref:C-type lectin domain-containing protein n=1 Tax=Exaiptasia diaphana TaxID=2652724 RepID=A0A913YU61_EXADI|nr:uncharacterized protein LOC110251542 isoform X2 [Exaiptasia diaphana]